jgi:hypothetical protein
MGSRRFAWGPSHSLSPQPFPHSLLSRSSPRSPRLFNTCEFGSAPNTQLSHTCGPMAGGGPTQGRTDTQPGRCRVERWRTEPTATYVRRHIRAHDRVAPAHRAAHARRSNCSGRSRRFTRRRFTRRVAGRVRSSGSGPATDMRDRVGAGRSAARRLSATGERPRQESDAWWRGVVATRTPGYVRATDRLAICDACAPRSGSWCTRAW